MLFGDSTSSAEVPPFWIFPQLLSHNTTVDTITQYPSQSLHVCESKMATLGDEDKSSSASSASHSSSWYYVEVVL